jgi:hypothetical protein
VPISVLRPAAFELNKIDKKLSTTMVKTNGNQYHALLLELWKLMEDFNQTGAQPVMSCTIKNMPPHLVEWLLRVVRDGKK